MTQSVVELDIIEERESPAKRSRYVLAGLIALAFITFFFGLGRLALLGPDEPRYAEVAREMFATGDYISTRLCGCLWFEKPVLFYWGAAASYHLFGVSEFAARFPAALAAFATVAFIYFALGRTFGLRARLMISLVLLTSGIFLGYARAAHMDMLLTAAVAVAVLSGYRSVMGEGRARLLWVMLCFATTGAAVLAKGLVGIVLVSGVLLPYLIVSGRWRAVRWQDCLLGIAIFLAVAATWYVPVTLRHGWKFIDEFFINHHFNRYVSNKYGHPQPVYFFLFIALAGMLPWTFFILPAAARLKRLRPKSDERDSLMLLAWIWTVVPLVFFSLSISKLPGYLLPVFPALAIIAGAEVDRLYGGERSRPHRAAGYLTALLVLAISLAFAIYVWRSGVIITGVGWAAYLAPLALSLVAVLVFVIGRVRFFISAVAAVVAAIVVGVVLFIFPLLNERESLKPLSVEVARALKPDEKIAFYIFKEFAPVFYAEGRVVCGAGKGSVLNALNPEKIEQELTPDSSLIIIAIAPWRDEFPKSERFIAEHIATQGNASAFRVRLRLKQRAESGE